MQHRIALATLAGSLLALQSWAGVLPVERAQDPALEGLWDACAQKNVQACLDLAQLFWSGKGTGWVDRDHATSAFLQGCNIDPYATASRLETECEDGKLMSCQHRARMIPYWWLNDRGIPRDEAYALQLFEKSCAGGNPDGCIDLGMRLACPGGAPCFGRPEGASVEDNRRRAREILQKQCDSGQPVACTEIVGLFHPEPFVTLNPETWDADKAKEDLGEWITLLERACNEMMPGDPRACEMLASYERAPRGGFQVRSVRGKQYPMASGGADRNQADEYVHRACLAGSSWSCMMESASLRHREPKKAFAAITRACDLGSTAACLQVAKAFVDGSGTSRNVDGAIEVLSSSCDGGPKMLPADGSSDACYELAALLGNRDPAASAIAWAKTCGHFGQSAQHCLALADAKRRGNRRIAKDPRGAAQILVRLCAQRTGMGCRLGGLMYLHGEGVERDLSEAARLFSRGCDGSYRGGMDDGGACWAIGVMHLNGEGAPRDDEKATRYLRRGCELGFEDACAVALEMDPAGALPVFAQMCERRKTPGCRLAGLMYAKGEGVERDADKALELLTRGCDGLYGGRRDDGRACLALGVMYLNGDGVSRDDDKGTKLLRRGCELAVDDACGALKERDPRGAASIVTSLCERSGQTCALAGFMHSMGEGVKRDQAKAAELFGRGCDSSDGAACFGLGVMHVNGDGVPRDNAEASSYLERACELGFEQACDAARQLEAGTEPAS